MNCGVDFSACPNVFRFSFLHSLRKVVIINLLGSDIRMNSKHFDNSLMFASAWRKFKRTFCDYRLFWHQHISILTISFVFLQLFGSFSLCYFGSKSSDAFVESSARVASANCRGTGFESPVIRYYDGGDSSFANNKSISDYAFNSRFVLYPDVPTYYCKVYSGIRLYDGGISIDFGGGDNNFGLFASASTSVDQSSGSPKINGYDIKLLRSSNAQSLSSWVSSFIAPKSVVDSLITAGKISSYDDFIGKQFDVKRNVVSQNGVVSLVKEVWGVTNIYYDDSGESLFIKSYFGDSLISYSPINKYNYYNYSLALLPGRSFSLIKDSIVKSYLSLGGILSCEILQLNNNVWVNDSKASSQLGLYLDPPTKDYLSIGKCTAGILYMLSALLAFHLAEDGNFSNEEKKKAIVLCLSISFFVTILTWLVFAIVLGKWFSMFYFFSSSVGRFLMLLTVFFLLFCLFLFYVARPQICKAS